MLVFTLIECMIHYIGQAMVLAENKENEMTTVKRYDVRQDCFPCHSKIIGFKHKLFTRARAFAIVKRLKKMGVDALATPYTINF